MQNWHIEYMAEYDRQRILAEVQEIHLERLARQARGSQPGLFERTMFNLANWMIAAGSQLRKRYEIPAANCNHPPTGSFAR